MKNRPNAFPKSQRLCNHTLIDRMFEPGNSSSMTAYPMRLVLRLEDRDGSEEMQLLISVPKRCFKHAVDRNRIKRQIREAFRTNRNKLTLPEGKKALLAVIWLDNKHRPTPVVTDKVINLLQRASEKICEK